MDGAVILSVLFISMIIGQVDGSTADPSATAPTITPTTAPTTATATQSPTVTTLVPTINYTCSMDGKIEIDTTNLGGYTRIAVGPYEESNGYLIIRQTDNNESNCFVGIENLQKKPATCILQNCNLTKPVIVYLMNDTNSRIIGGKNFHEYELTCSIPEKGLSLSVAAAPVKIDNIDSATTEYISVSLLMLITPLTVRIGDKLNISITIKQPASQVLYVLPTQCIAKSSKTNGGQNLTLMANGATKDRNVFGEFNVGTQRIASADMYAFRFIDSTTVHIECDVTVCKNKTCVSGEYNGINSRRRRSAQEDISGETFEVSAFFQIGDKETDNQDSGHCNVRWNPTVVISLLLLTVTAFIRNN